MPEASARPDPLAVLTTLTRAIAREGDLDSALGALLDLTAAAVGGRAAAIYLQDPDRAEIEPLLAIGVDEAALPILAEAPGELDDPVSVTARDRSPSLATGDASGRFGVASACRSAAFRPLVTTRAGIDLPVGVLVVGWADLHETSAGEEQILDAASDLAAVAIDRARLASLVAERSEWFERVAHSDPLTGLANQRTFGRVLELELARAGRQGGEVALALIDVDGFREVNDTAGHETGDDVLRAVASVLAGSVRLVDTVARHGGDEFVIVAPGSAGVTVARRILAAVAAIDPVDGVRASVSIGLARFPVDGTSSGELLAAAATALDQARAEGPGRMLEATPQRA